MFCYQCEQTFKGTGCTIQGVCGKKPEVAALQDLLIYTLAGLSKVAVDARKQQAVDEKIGIFTLKASFSTLTNVDFDPDRFADLIHEAVQLRDDLKKQLKDAGSTVQYSDPATTLKPGSTMEELIKQGEAVGIKTYPADDPDILSLKHTVSYGIKGVSAYA